MGRNLVLTPACWLLWPQAASAGPVGLTCLVIATAPGELGQRCVHIDSMNCLVWNDAVTLTDDAVRLLAKSIEEFVGLEPRRPTWSNGTDLDRMQAGVFTVDPLTGEYAFVTRPMEQFSQGSCHERDKAA